MYRGIVFGDISGHLLELALKAACIIINVICF